MTGHETAVDGQWASLFLANFHFAASADQLPRVPATAFCPPELLVLGGRGAVLHRLSDDLHGDGSIFSRTSLRLRLALALLVVIVASFTYSVIFTSMNAPSAFFSPLTRAWELALGGLIAAANVSFAAFLVP